MIRPTSQLIFCLFLEQFEDFLPTYSANGEIEVWRNTLPCLLVRVLDNQCRAYTNALHALYKVAICKKIAWIIAINV